MIRTQALALVFLLLVGALAACGEPAPQPAATPDEATNGPPSLELLLQVGCAECDDERRITPTAVALLNGDRLAVLDSWEPFVRVFDALGNPELAFGRKGEGPGELGVDGGGRWMPGTWILSHPAGIAVIDTMPPVLEVFDDGGDLLVEAGRDIPRIRKTEQEIEDERNSGPAMSRNREIDPLRLHIESAGLRVDGAGRIWVLTQRWGENDSAFDVFRSDGRYLGEVVVDTIVRRDQWAAAPVFMSGDRLAGIVRQADGSDQVWVWRITDPGER